MYIADNTGTVFLFYLFCFSMWCSQPDCQIIRKVVTSNAKYECMPDIAACKNRQIRSAAAEIDKCRSQFLFFISQNRFT
jgi:hypothetical protein